MTIHLDPPRATILVVDDNREIRTLLEDFLTAGGRGYRVVLARSGQEALSRFQEHQDDTDLVLLDVVLPDIDGVEVCRRIKALEKGRLTPIIMVTARNDVSSKVDGLEGGAEDYVTKPINFTELDARIRAMLRVRAQHLELLQRSAAEPRGQDLQRLLAQANKLSTIGGMVSEVIHEINNPLNGILNYTGLLRDGEVEGEDEVRELLGFIRSEAERIHSLVGSLLTLRRAGGSLEPTDLTLVLDDVFRLSKYLLKKNNVVLMRHDVSGRCVVLGEQNRLVQVILNLVNNAIHALEQRFGDAPGKQLEVFLEGSEEGVTLRLHDNGAGIPREIQARIFEPEFTTKRPGEGTGLGLTIARDIVAEHKGRITFVSEPGQFTEFVLWFPAWGATARASSREAEASHV